MGAALLLFLVALPLRADPPGQGWTLVWNDEFTGSSLDASKWSWGQLPWGGNHHNSSYASMIVAGNSYLDGSGNLVLGVRPGSFPATDGTTQPYSEGMIYSQGKFDYAYGYVEVSAKVSSATGSWPAFWMLMSGWPPEIDVMEWFKSENNRMHTGLAWNNNGTTSWDDVNTYDSSMQDSWHTWALDWSPGSLAIYKDGTDQRWSTSGDRVPTDPMYFILNSGVQSGQTSWWHDTLFDYIRLWKRNEVVLNGDFEHWSGPWDTRNGATVVSASGRNSSRGLRIATGSGGDGGAEQTAYGLMPNTSYILTGYGRSGGNWWPAMRLGVKNYGGADINDTTTNPSWDPLSLKFTTGPTNTTGRVYLYVPESWGTAYADDIKLRHAAAVDNPHFETGELENFWNVATYGDTAINWGSARSGNCCVRFNGSAHAACGVGQQVAGLTPNTTYELSAWSRNSWQGTKIGAINFDSTGADLQYDISADQTYSKGTVTFKTGSNYTTATIYAWFYRTNGWANSYVDDFFLCEPLAAPWSKADVGAVGLAGTSGRRGSAFVLQASGGDIWTTADAFHFVYQTLTGDGKIVARLRSMEHTHDYAKAGVMMRDSLGAGARHVMVDWMPNGHVELVRRTATNATAVADWTASVAAAPWVKLVRKGNTFSGYYSDDGTNWTQVAAAQTIAMPATIYVGLPACAHDTTQLTETVTDNVFVGPWDADGDIIDDAWELQYFGNLTTANAASDTDGDGVSDLQEFLLGSNPTVADACVAIVSPANGDSVPPDSVTITACATNGAGPFNAVEFYADGALLGTDTATPFTFAWTNAPVSGSHVLAVRAISSLGFSLTSAPVQVTFGFRTLIATGAVWRYLDTGTNPGAAWPTNSFDDSAWKSGPAQLGYGDGDEATVVSFGANTNNKYITTYFRRSFLAATNTFTNLTVRLLRNDGAVLYLNGLEAWRNNMPATNPILSTTLAATSVANGDETNFFSTNLSAALLVPGTNVLAVEIHQAAANSSDISFDLGLGGLARSGFAFFAMTNQGASNVACTTARLTGALLSANGDPPDVTVFWGPADAGTNRAAWPGHTALGARGLGAFSTEVIGLAPGSNYFCRCCVSNALDLAWSDAAGFTALAALPMTLVPTGAVWKYLDNGSNPGNAWRSNSFNDAAWKSGSAQFGYGDGDEATVVSFGPNATNKYITTYFRRSFPVFDTNLVSSLTARLLRDDGAVVYLNGAEVWRNNLPTNGTINFLTLALTNVGGTDETTHFYTNFLNPALLLNGPNLVAVEIHQFTNTSSDISFDLALDAAVRILTPPVLAGACASGNVTLSSTPDAGFFQLYTTTNVSPSAQWTPATNPPFLSNGHWMVTLPATNSGGRFFRLQTP